MVICKKRGIQMYGIGNNIPMYQVPPQRFGPVGAGFAGISPLTAGLIGAGLGFIGGELLDNGPGYGGGFGPGFGGYGPGFGGYGPGFGGFGPGYVGYEGFGPGYGAPGFYGNVPGYNNFKF